MGELIGKAVEGELYYADRKEFDRIRSLNAEPAVRTALFADMARLNALYMIARAGSGHIGSSFSSMDVVSWLHLNEMRTNEDGSARDLYFSSKGHDAPGLYAVMIALGKLPAEYVHKLRQADGLPGHPDVRTPNMVTNTGALGMGISKAKGMAFAHRRRGLDVHLYVMTGDGELQEGQIWESLVSAANDKLREITVVVDHNKLQSDFLLSQTSDLGDLPAKFAAFGWHVERVDGHDLGQLAAALERCRKADGPQVIICDTIKGKGVSFMEHTAMESDAAQYTFHSGAPKADQYTKAAQELIDSINRQLDKAGAASLELEKVQNKPAPQPGETRRLLPAYSDALIAAAERHDNLVALDADLLLDTGLIPFRQRFPERTVECGIAEMDMVSQAGGMALKGMIPVCNSFACFLSTRPNEQIYNNATEHTKVIYVGWLAGMVPGGPGHSHQSVRDIAAVGAMPGVTILEPSCPEEVAPLLDWAIEESRGSSYFRMVSVPWQVPFALPAGYKPSVGHGVRVGGHDGEAVIVTYGMVMLAQACAAADLLKQRGIGLEVVNLPWLNRVDGAWLAKTLAGKSALFTLDNHYLDGGQGERVMTAAFEQGLGGLKARRFGLEKVPVSGSNADVLKHAGLDAESLAAGIAATLGH
ncbi:transketolase subunit A [Tistlia consotensis]|uniref:Transketolase n=1 Tax=Tistlia consotensis USBA 355 TaxID=560819 RepID=A0A1Y6BAX6_9PROT|nr:transketolase C-terminal domain-containing protein [Tistlia consotensis]SME98387.1 transketolase [Tistlia consotensis USBA 355]SNR57760.1 transketolase subunit A [Tistlia consotensis]